MGIRSLVSWILKNSDMVGSSIKIRYNNSTLIQTPLGGILSILICFFILFFIIYDGEDIIKKQKPISRFSKDFINSSEILLRQFPVGFYFVESNGAKIENVERYVRFEAIYLDIIFNTTTNKVQALNQTLFIEKCNASHFGDFQYIFSDPQYKVPISDLYCLNPSKRLSLNGITEYSPLSVANEFGSVPSRAVQVRVFPCTNVTGGCVSRKEFEAKMSQFTLGTFYLDYYVDLSKYEQPNVPFVTSFAQPLTFKIGKGTYFRIKKSHVFTDSGVVLEDITEKSFFQVDGLRIDILNYPDLIFQFCLEASRIVDQHYRKYKKFQDVLANVGGFIKLLVILTSTFMNFYSYNLALFSLSNELFEIRRIDIETSKKPRQHAQAFESQSQIIVPSCETQERAVPKNVNATFFDYSKSVCHCDSKYTKNHYKSLQTLITSKIEIRELIGHIYKTEDLFHFTFKEEEERLLTLKSGLVQKLTLFERDMRNKVIQSEIIQTNCPKLADFAN